MIIIADLITLLAGPGPTMRSPYRSEPWSIQSVVRICGPLIARPTCQSPEILFAALICTLSEGSDIDCASSFSPHEILVM